MAKLKKFRELPYNIRKSPERRHNYIVDQINELLELEDDEEDVQEVTPSTRDLSITVDDGENAISGVSVAIGNITGTTGPAGGCTLKGVSDGEQTITASKEGYESYSDTITVSENSITFTISMTASAPSEETPGAE
ncbi:MAG: PEGA domain-containing protein [Methanobrevibacter sp.]|nr:PEGA domain-containing protein [Methanobrevibacter sp.]